MWSHIALQILLILLLVSGAILAYSFGPTPKDVIDSKVGFIASHEFDILLFALFMRTILFGLLDNLVKLAEWLHFVVYTCAVLQISSLLYCLFVAYESVYIVGHGNFTNTLFESHNNDVDDEAIVMWWLVLVTNGVSLILCLLDVLEARARSTAPRRFGLCVSVFVCRQPPLQNTAQPAKAVPMNDADLMF